MKHAVVKASELGHHCWLPQRFVGGRCERVTECTYPEKATCKAVDAEIQYLNDRMGAVIRSIGQKMAPLIAIKDAAAKENKQ